MPTSQFLVLLLAALAFVIAILLICHVSAWPLIVLYWLILTLKNLSDFHHASKKGGNFSER